MLEGFYCPKRQGGNVKFEFCYKTCVRHCKPLPVLLSLARQDRASEQNVWHVTEILQPPQVVFLKRGNPYYVSPDSLIDMNVGSAWHSKLEETKKYVKEVGLENDYLMERNFKEEFAFKDGKIAYKPKEPWKQGEELITLSGTSDLYVKSTKTLWDYKVMKFYYSFKYISEGNWEGSTIPMQLNIYRVYQYPEAEEIKIFCYLKDYKLNMADKYDLSQTETLQVPRIPDDKVKSKVLALLGEHVEAQKTGKPRACTQEERWWNDRQGVYLRCEHYCSVKEICPQYEVECVAREVKEEKAWKEKR